MAKDVIITPASGKLDFYGTLGGSVLANINLTDNNDLSLSTTSGNLIIGDASRDVYIGDGINEVDIVFEQNGEIRSVAGKYITVNAGTVNATGVAVNTSSPTAVMHVYGSTPSGTVLNVEGTNGSLFSVVDNLDGTLMSVNNNAGLPVLEVFSDDKIVGGRFGQNDFVVSSSGNVGIGKIPDNSYKLDVNGKLNLYNSTSLSNGQIYVENVDGYLYIDSNAEININSTFLYINSNAQANGSFTATSFIGNGSGLTGTAASLTAGSVTTNANLTGDVTSVGNSTSIAAGVIVNADINASAAIADTKLATISTAGKVANSATTATNANTASAIVARDVSGNFSAGTITAALNGNANTVTNGVYTTGNQNVSGVKTFTSQIINTTANNTANGGGQIYLNGATGNRIDFNTNGVAAPSFTTRSAGTKIVLYPNVGASSADYAIGIESSTLWNSVPTTSQQFKWYAGTTNIATLTGAGVLTVAGSTSQINVDNLRLDGNTLSATNANGNISLTPNGIGGVFVGGESIIFQPSSYKFEMQDSGPGPMLNFNDSEIFFKTSGGAIPDGEIYALYIDRSDTSAMVGIGTNTPAQFLHVTGNILCDKLYLEKTSAPTISSNTLTINLSNSQLFLVSLNSNITTLTISNVPSTSNITVGFTIIFTADGTARSVTWPGSVKWAGGTAPTLTSTNAKRDVLSFVSTDNGTTWLGFVGGQDY